MGEAPALPASACSVLLSSGDTESVCDTRKPLGFIGA
jgi:hypothetical protein